MFRIFACCRMPYRECGCQIKNCRKSQIKYTREALIINEITYNKLLEMVKGGAVLIDTRTKQEFLEGHLERAILIPYYEIARRIETIVPDKDRTIVLYCKNGGRSSRAYEMLDKLGYVNIYNLKGGMEEI